MPKETTNEDIIAILTQMDITIKDNNKKIDKMEADTNAKMNKFIEIAEQQDKKINEIRDEAIKTNEAVKQNEKKIKKNEMKLAGYEENTETLKFEIEKLKARELINDITIAGINKCEDQQLPDIFDKICRIINVGVNLSECTIYRAKGSDKHDGLVIVKFRNPRKKFEIISAKKKFGPLFTEQLYEAKGAAAHIENKQIFVNHHITPYFNGILYKARQAKIQNKIFAAWANSAGVYYKINEKDMAKRFDSFQEIERVLNTDGQDTESSATVSTVIHRTYSAPQHQESSSTGNSISGRPYSAPQPRTSNRSHQPYENQRNSHEHNRHPPRNNSYNHNNQRNRYNNNQYSNNQYSNNQHNNINPRNKRAPSHEMDRDEEGKRHTNGYQYGSRRNERY